VLVLVGAVVEVHVDLIHTHTQTKKKVHVDLRVVSSYHQARQTRY
jgi:hypothetical protein